MQAERRLEQLLSPLDNNLEFEGDRLVIENKQASRLQLLLGIGCLLAVLYMMINVIRQFQAEQQMDWFEVGLAGTFLVGALYFFRTQNKKITLDRRSATIQEGGSSVGTAFSDVTEFVVEDQRYFANYLFSSFQAKTHGGKRISLFRYNRRKLGEEFPQEVAQALRDWMHTK